MDLRELSDLLGIPAQTLKKQATRMNIEPDQNGQLSKLDAISLVSTYTQPRGNRPQETTEAARQIILNIQNIVGAPTPPIPEPAPAPRPTTLPELPPLAPPPPAARYNPAPSPEPQSLLTIVRNDAIIVLVLLLIIIWQIINTADVAGYISTGRMESSLTSYLFAIPAQFTAFLLTVHNGGKTYLRVFLGFEIAINIIHYHPWTYPDPYQMWPVCILLSIFGPAVIYSLFHLISSKVR